jgi:hypothetical protein
MWSGYPSKHKTIYIKLIHNGKIAEKYWKSLDKSGT